MDNNDYMSYYNDDYNYNDEEYHYESNKNNKKKKQKSKSNGMLYLVLAIIAIILIFVFFTNSCTQTGTGYTDNPLVLSQESFNLEVGETAQITASVTNDDENPVITWESSDPSIVSVENGVIKAKKEGLAVITVTYQTGINDETFKQECTVIVNKKSSTPGTPSTPGNPPSSSDTTKPTLEVTITNGTSDWYTSDVSIKVSASDANGISNVKYAINCNSGCTYTNVSNNGTFKVSNNGTNNVTVIATDKNGNQTTKNVTVKIDKSAPVVKLNITGTKVYNNTGSVSVCASCTDSGSGCAQNQVCKTYTTNQTNVTIEVSDKANNKTKSTTFSVIIDKTAPTCTLRINEETGQLTGTASDSGGSGVKYYGYSSSYTGSNSNNKAGVQGLNYFYVKDNAGNVGRCSINLTTGYRSRTCAEKEYSWKVTNSETCGDGFKNRSREEAEAVGRLWYRTNCEAAPSSYIGKRTNCTNSTCKCCKEYTGTLNGCKSFEGSEWSDWSYTPIQGDTYTQVDTKLISAD